MECRQRHSLTFLGARQRHTYNAAASGPALLDWALTSRRLCL